MADAWFDGALLFKLETMIGAKENINHPLRNLRRETAQLMPPTHLCGASAKQLNAIEEINL
jgi:hypothetical protein